MAARAGIAICGAGIVGIATAYALSQQANPCDVVLIDPRAPLSLTTAASGENYRNWWPHPTLVAFMDRSLDLLEDLHRKFDGTFRMTRRGYAYATRERDSQGFLARLTALYGNVGAGPVRVFEPGDPAPASAPRGVDVILDQPTIRDRFPHLTDGISALAHVRRAGDFDTQQFGQRLLSRAKACGVRELRGEITAIQESEAGFRITVKTAGDSVTLGADKLVNAAGPFAARLAEMLGIALPLKCIYQQKIAFEDRAGVLPRQAPFTIDLDAAKLAWSAEETALLASDPGTHWLTETLPGGLHIKPEGGTEGRWVKLGWAYNDRPSEPAWDPSGSDDFPEVLLRRARQLVPGLQIYGETIPRPFSHYGGYYTRTSDNWPLIGPMGDSDAFMVCGLSGYGTMAAAAAGELCAAWATGRDLPGYAPSLSLARYDNPLLMAEIAALDSDGAL